MFFFGGGGGGGSTGTYPRPCSAALFLDANLNPFHIPDLPKDYSCSRLKPPYYYFPDEWYPNLDQYSLISFPYRQTKLLKPYTSQRHTPIYLTYGSIPPPGFLTSYRNNIYQDTTLSIKNQQAKCYEYPLISKVLSDTKNGDYLNDWVDELSLSSFGIEWQQFIEKYSQRSYQSISCRMTKTSSNNRRYQSTELIL